MPSPTTTIAMMRSEIGAEMMTAAVAILAIPIAVEQRIAVAAFEKLVSFD